MTMAYFITSPAHSGFFFVDEFPEDCQLVKFMPCENDLEGRFIVVEGKIIDTQEKKIVTVFQF